MLSSFFTWMREEMPFPKFCVFMGQLKMDEVQKPINNKKYITLLENSPVGSSSIHTHSSLAFRECVLEVSQIHWFVPRIKIHRLKMDRNIKIVRRFKEVLGTYHMTLNDLKEGEGRG